MKIDRLGVYCYKKAGIGVKLRGLIGELKLIKEGTVGRG